MRVRVIIGCVHGNSRLTMTAKHNNNNNNGETRTPALTDTQHFKETSSEVTYRFGPLDPMLCWWGRGGY